MPEKVLGKRKERSYSAEEEKENPVTKVEIIEVPKKLEGVGKKPEVSADEMPKPIREKYGIQAKKKQQE